MDPMLKIAAKLNNFEILDIGKVLLPESKSKEEQASEITEDIVTNLAIAQPIKILYLR